MLCEAGLPPHAEPSPWRFDVPEVPDSVTAVNDKLGWIWVRDGIVWLLWRVAAGTGSYRIHEAELVTRMPLVECIDPRGATR